MRQQHSVPDVDDFVLTDLLLFLIEDLDAVPPHIQEFDECGSAELPFAPATTTQGSEAQASVWENSRMSTPKRFTESGGTVMVERGGACGRSSVGETSSMGETSPPASSSEAQAGGP